MIETCRLYNIHALQDTYNNTAIISLNSSTHTHTHTHARTHARTLARTHTRTHTHMFNSTGCQRLVPIAVNRATFYVTLSPTCQTVLTPTRNKENSVDKVGQAATWQVFSEFLLSVQ